MTENIQQKSGDIKDILKIMSRANETFAYEIYIPSLQKNVMFREINTSQQKRLLKAVIDSPVYNTEFIFSLREIIKENCIDDIDINNLTIFDKLIIALMLRSISINNDMVINFPIPDSKEVVSRKISLKDIADVAIKDVHVEPMTIKDDRDIFEILCNLPTIEEEFNLEKELRKNVETIEIKNESELRETIGEVFTNEVVKYIKQINIKNKDGVTELNLKGMSFKDRLALLGQLPAKTTNKIIDYIKSIKDQFEKILLFKEQINGKTVEQRLKIDASFFTVS